MMMKKVKLLIFPLVAAVAALTACAGEVNQGPELIGVDNVACLANTAVDLLEGVAAVDLEDGDITPALQITVTPEVEVEKGYVTFPKAGEYDVCYEVRDSGGKLARTTVTASVKEREVYLDSVLTNGFALSTSGNAKVLKEGLCGNVYSFNASGGVIAENIKLTRTYALKKGVEYVFAYTFDCNVSGRIKIAADGAPFAEKQVRTGGNELEFAYTPKDGTVEIGLWLGGLDGEIEIALSRAQAKRADGGELAKDFKFNDRITNRDDYAHATVSASDDGRSATLEVTQPADAIWKVGMFVNTGIRLISGVSYDISFDADSALGNYYEICIQKDKFNEEGMVVLQKPQGRVSRTVTATDGFNGDLWLFIRSGTSKNIITVSDLSVVANTSIQTTETFAIGQVEVKHSNGGEGSAVCEYGKITYEVGAFGTKDNNNELFTPAFTLLNGGAASNYVVSFKAKATQPVKFVFAGPVDGWWDPVFVWGSSEIGTEENTYSFYCNNVDMDGVKRLVWQFGSYVNAAYTERVIIEISDIKICFKSDLDG